MCIALESAALVVDKRWRVESKPEVSQTPSKSPPAALRIPPGRLKKRAGLVFAIFISLGTRRAKCKKVVLGGACYEYASKLQFVKWIFNEFLALMHFVFLFLQKCACRSGHKHIFENRC